MLINITNQIRFESIDFTPNYANMYSNKKICEETDKNFKIAFAPVKSAVKLEDSKVSESLDGREMSLVMASPKQVKTHLEALCKPLYPQRFERNHERVR